VNSDVRNLVHLQDVELKIAGLQKQISDIPIQVQNSQAELDRIRQEHELHVAQSQDLSKTRRALEGEVDMLRTKLSRFKDQLMAVKTNKEYTAMLHEIQMAEERIRQEEDKILENMEKFEILDQQLRTESNELDARCDAIRREMCRLEESVPSLEADAAKLKVEKEAMESQVSPEMLARYRRLAPARKGTAMAEARNELCSACHIRIRPQVHADLMNTENIHTCESCSRILFVRERL